MDENLTRGYMQLSSGRHHEAIRSSSHHRQDSTSYIQIRDRCSCIYIALILCGAGFLLPYNSFITAVDYYQEKYPNTTIIFDMSMTYIILAFIGVFINSFLVELISLHTRITFGYVLSFFTLLFVAICDVWMKMFTPDMSYYVTLVAMAVVALGCTVQQSSFYGYASMLPLRYTQAVMTGESAAGLLVSINRIITKALMPDKTASNTIIFFIISIVIVFFCFVMFHVTKNAEFVQHHVTTCKNAGLADDQRGITNQSSNPEEVSLVDILDGNVSRDSYGVLVLQSPTNSTDENRFSPDGAPAQLPVSNRIPSTSSSTGGDAEPSVRVRVPGNVHNRHVSALQAFKAGCSARYRVAKNVWPYMLSIGCAYFVTLCLFPGIESEVVSCRLGSWMPVILIALFNAFDFLGKIFASVEYDWHRGKLLFLTFSRAILIPLMMFCATPRAEPVLKGEAWSMALSMLLGLSNGYFGSVPMILAPTRVPDEQKELTGNIMTLSYSIGLTSGSVVAYLLDDILGPSSATNMCLPNTTSANIIFDITTTSLDVTTMEVNTTSML